MYCEWICHTMDGGPSWIWYNVHFTCCIHSFQKIGKVLALGCPIQAAVFLALLHVSQIWIARSNERLFRQGRAPFSHRCCSYMFQLAGLSMHMIRNAEAVSLYSSLPSITGTRLQSRCVWLSTCAPSESSPPGWRRVPVASWPDQIDNVFRLWMGH